MKLFVTGSAGFIGSSLCVKLLDRGDDVIGIDNHNDYYDPKIKEARLKRFVNKSNYKHYKVDLSDKKSLDNLFKDHKPKGVINLAAQAGVRYSMENPLAYINSNVVGFAHILENCRYHKVQHLVYASTSSVYGANTKMPFSEHDNVNHPLSVYAASKKSNELMAHSYSYLYQLPTTGLRFFTVYGPWGRPDMALFKFTKNTLEGKPIEVFNNGNHKRDFTYIDDIIEGIYLATKRFEKSERKQSKFKIYNISNGKPVFLKNFIKEIENNLGIQSKKKYLPLQLGDVHSTHGDITELKKDFKFKPVTDYKEGIRKFILWYKEFYE